MGLLDNQSAHSENKPVSFLPKYKSGKNNFVKQFREEKNSYYYVSLFRQDGLLVNKN